MKTRKLLERIATAIIRVAKWYMRRGRAAKAVLFIAVLSPALIYSYWQANIYTEKYSTPPLLLTPSTPDIGLEKTRCNKFFDGKTLYIMGILSVPTTCFYLNRTTILYPVSQNGFAEAVLAGSTSSPVAAVFVLPTNKTLSINGTTARIVSVALVVYMDRLNYTAIRGNLTEHGLEKVFCSTAVPSTGWGVRSVPEQLYDFVCLHRRS